MKNIIDNHDIFSYEELKKMGFRSLGKEVKIWKTACFYNRDKISIGDFVEIKSFCIIEGNVFLEQNVSIGEFCYLSAMINHIVIKKNTILYQRVLIDADKEKDEKNIIIEKDTIIETQCNITKTIEGKKNIIEMLSII